MEVVDFLHEQGIVHRDLKVISIWVGLFAFPPASTLSKKKNFTKLAKARERSLLDKGKKAIETFRFRIVSCNRRRQRYANNVRNPTIYCTGNFEQQCGPQRLWQIGWLLEFGCNFICLVNFFFSLHFFIFWNCFFFGSRLSGQMPFDDNSSNSTVFDSIKSGKVFIPNIRKIIGLLCVRKKKKDQFQWFCLGWCFNWSKRFNQMSIVYWSNETLWHKKGSSASLAHGLRIRNFNKTTRNW